MMGFDMNTEIGSYDAKTRLPELLRQVRKGKSFTITNRGEAVAELVPVRHSARLDTASAAREMEAFMHTRPPVRGINIKALIEEGRR